MNTFIYRIQLCPCIFPTPSPFVHPTSFGSCPICVGLLYAIRIATNPIILGSDLLALVHPVDSGALVVPDNHSSKWFQGLVHHFHAHFFGEQ